MVQQEYMSQSPVQSTDLSAVYLLHLIEVPDAHHYAAHTTISAQHTLHTDQNRIKYKNGQRSNLIRRPRDGQRKDACPAHSAATLTAATRYNRVRQQSHLLWGCGHGKPCAWHTSPQPSAGVQHRQPLTYIRVYTFRPARHHARFTPDACRPLLRHHDALPRFLVPPNRTAQDTYTTWP